MDASYNLEPSNYSEEELKELFGKVFGQELLREKVLDYVIHDKEKKNAIWNIRLCRLICKDWLQSTSRILLRHQEPLFHLRFTRGDKKNIGEILGEFSNAVSGPSRFQDPVSPFAIKADSQLLIGENRKSFYNFLARARGLVEWDLELSDNTEFVLDANIMFPKLRKFVVIIYGGNHKWSKHFASIQAVLNACEELKSLNVESRTFPFYNHPPQALVFPSSITELDLGKLWLDPEALISNLPPLKVLRLRLLEIARLDGLVSRILEKLKQTLEVFYISLRSITRQGLGQPVTFRLPLLEKLQSLQIRGENYDLGQLSSLEQLVPALRDIHLDNHTVSTFRQWADRSRFFSVEALYVSLRSPEPHQRGLAPGVNFDLSTMESLKTAFPNVRELQISIYDRDTSVFAFIMKEMTNLKILRIFATDSSAQWEDNVPAHFWDALLLGIPVESIAALNSSPEWETLEDERDALIRNMAALEVLDIYCRYGNTTFELSSAVFRNAFLLMPNLTKLVFNNRFRVSEEMQQAWKGQGRFIKIAE